MAKTSQKKSRASSLHLEMDRAAKRAVKKALLDHKRAGNSIVIMRNGKIIWLKPKQIPVK